MERKRLIPLFLLFLASCYKSRPAEVTLIPSGYKGWVGIEYGVHGAPELKQTDGKYIVRVSNSGRLKTSTQTEWGLADDKYFYVSGNEREELSIAFADSDKGLIRGIKYIGTLITGGKQRNFKVFFVGSQSEYQAQRNDDERMLSE